MEHDYTTVAGVLSAVSTRQLVPVSAHLGDDLHARLHAHTLACEDYLGTPGEPVRVTKHRAGLACRCGQLAALPVPPLAMTSRVAVGLAVDRLVTRWTLTGEPVPENPLRWAATAACAVGDTRLQQLIDRLPPLARQRIDTEVHERVTRLVAVFGPLGDGWWPRSELRLATSLGATVQVTGRVDVTVGGTTTSHPPVLFETKTTWRSDRHDDELRWYALLHTITLGPPAAVIGVDTNGTTTVHIPTPETLEHEAARWAVAIAELVAQTVGDTPTRTSGDWCAHCPALRSCDVGAEQLSGPGLWSHADDTDQDEPSDWSDGV